MKSSQVISGQVSSDLTRSAQIRSAGQTRSLDQSTIIVRVPWVPVGPDSIPRIPPPAVPSRYSVGTVQRQRFHETIYFTEEDWASHEKIRSRPRHNQPVALPPRSTVQGLRPASWSHEQRMHMLKRFGRLGIGETFQSSTTCADAGLRSIGLANIFWRSK